MAKKKKSKAIAKWAKHKFVVTPTLIRSFQDLKIKGHCNVENKDKDNEKEFVTRKNGKPTELSFTVDLNALTGVKDVYSEAIKFVSEADEGKTDFFYLGSKKLLGIKMMLVTAEISEIVMFPKKGNKWIGCSVKLTFKKASKGKTEGGSNGDDEGGSNGFTARLYYTTPSGATGCVTAWSSVSYADALKKAKAKLPRNANWYGQTRTSTPTRQMGETQPSVSPTSRTQSSTEETEQRRKEAEQGSQTKTPTVTPQGRVP